MVSALADVTDLESNATQAISMAGVFRDPYGDGLFVSVSSDDETVAAVEAASDGSSLTLTGFGAGGATIAVTAEEADDNRVTDTLDVSVVELELTSSDVVARGDANNNGTTDIPEYIRALRDRAAGRFNEAER